MTEKNNEILTLLDEEGQEHNFVVLDILTVNEKGYVILLPADEETDSEAEDAQAIVFRIEKADEGESLLVVEDENELEAVAKAWEEAYDEEGLEEEEDILP